MEWRAVARRGVEHLQGRRCGASRRLSKSQPAETKVFQGAWKRGSQEMPAPNGEVEVKCAVCNPTHRYDPDFAFKRVKAEAHIRDDPVATPASSIWMCFACFSRSLYFFASRLPFPQATPVRLGSLSCERQERAGPQNVRDHATGTDGLAGSLLGRWIFCSPGRRHIPHPNTPNVAPATFHCVRSPGRRHQFDSPTPD